MNFWKPKPRSQKAANKCGQMGIHSKMVAKRKAAKWKIERKLVLEQLEP